MFLRRSLAIGFSVASFLSLNGIDSCTPDPVPIGEECAVESCGARLGAPTILCEDGSLGGNTGRCLEQADGMCGWELRECPPPTECAMGDCGPMPPQRPGDPPLSCARVADGSCQWTAGAACALEDCGAPLRAPSYICDDGSLGGNTGRCIPGAEGVCGWELIDCPRGECTVDECGPAPGAPNYLCEDGSWGGPTGCTRAPDGTCGYGFRDCPAAMACVADGDCGADRHCEGGVCRVGSGCGGMSCDPSSQYCSAVVPGVPGAETSYDCAPLPESAVCITAPSCATCFPMPSGGAMCADEADGIHVTLYTP